ncbi:MAG TPA: DUF6364 family protein [Spirochaetota bacterium]|jgi:hypothetical protein|nr:DUF6364 family protein [Spirochaetota bacterium]HOH37035.1 DUF6364 family protein [Spirochaetota bacterium]HPJ15408.1 DUF6364 family protein [Spirochaetota bacterium]HPM34709.1 DUF6364 family protein [Spirochaetota bacterium]HPY02697.1 DUF6364 family protein [Spirochaetota bacterium]
MQTKLTLSIDKTIIHKAKLYANRREKSLSQIVEDYLKSISANEMPKSTSDNIPPVTKSLAGILKGKDDFDLKSSITEYLEKKHK